jgi:hypothetical protein
MARAFNGANQYFTTGDSSRWANLLTWTISAWVYPTATRDGAGCCIVSPGYPYGNNRMPFMLYYGGDFVAASKFSANIYTGGGWYNCVDPAAVALNTWYHLCGSFGAGVLRIYRNGVQAATTSGAVNGANTADIPLLIGRRWDTGGAPYFPGYISDVSIWNYVLTPGEVAMLAAGFTPWRYKAAGEVQQCYFPMHGQASAEIDMGFVGVGLSPINGPIPKAASEGPQVRIFGHRG